MLEGFLNRNRPVLGVAIAVALMIPALAAAGPVLVDRHTSKWTKGGDFRLHFYGTLANGTVCPPSPYALLRYSIDQDKPEYVRGFSVSPESEPGALAQLEAGDVCVVAFTGTVFFSWHHVKLATITATSATPINRGR